MRRVFSPAAAPQVKDQKKAAPAAVQSGQPAVTLRQISKEGFVVYNAAEDPAASIYVTQLSERAYFEGEEEYSPKIVPIQDDCGMSAVKAPAAVQAVKEPPHNQPSEIFIHAKARPQYEPIDFDEVKVIRKAGDKAKDSNSDEQPIAGIYVEGHAKQSSSLAPTDAATVPMAAVRISAQAAVTSGAGAVSFSHVTPLPSVKEATVPAAETVSASATVVSETDAVEIADEVRDLLFLVVPEVAQDAQFLCDDAADYAELPEDGLEGLDGKFSLRTETVQ